MTATSMELGSELSEELLLEFPNKFYEESYERGWTDGLPVLPPIPSRVQEFVAASGHKGDELIAIMPPRKGKATIEVIAANAVMAGCRPEYMPLIVTVIKDLTESSFPLEHMQVTTNPMTPFLLVNGPIRKTLDINYGTSCLGPGWRANATIGRAIRFVLNNIGGAKPGVYSKASLSSPLRYSYMCGENEEENPWTPFHVERGFTKDQSTVTLFRAFNFCNISGAHGGAHEEILRQIATHMLPMFSLGDGALVLLGVNHTRALFEAGLSKRDIQVKLWEYARLPISYFSQAFVTEEIEAGRCDGKMVWRTRTPEEFYIAVAGGPGPQDVYIAAGMPRTSLIPSV